jgi:hypothetical protein
MPYQQAILQLALCIEKCNVRAAFWYSKVSVMHKVCHRLAALAYLKL